MDFLVAQATASVLGSSSALITEYLNMFRLLIFAEGSQPVLNISMRLKVWDEDHGYSVAYLQQGA